MGLTDLPNYKAGVTLETIYPPILICVGIVGNLLSMSVLLMRKNRKTSTAILLIGLATADIMVLLVALTEKWINAVFSYSLRTTSDAICKVHVFLTYYLLQLSPWFLIVITVERVCCVRYPHMVKDTFTRKRSMYVLVGITIVLGVFNSHLLYGFGKEFIKEKNITLCSPNDYYIDFMFYVWPWLDFSLMFAIPCMILIVGNILIGISLKASFLFNSSIYKADATDKHVPHKFYFDKASGHLNRMCKLLSRSISSASRKSSFQRIQANNIFLVKTMLMLNLSFIICVSPINVLTIGQAYWYPLPTSIEQTAELHLISRVCFMLMYCNNSINFFLYILLGPKFRKDILRNVGALFKCRKVCSYHSSHYKVNEISFTSTLSNK